MTDRLVAALAQAMRDANTTDAWTQGPYIVPAEHFAQVAADFMDARDAPLRRAAQVRDENLTTSIAALRDHLAALQAILLPHTPASFAWPDVLVEAEAQAADVRLYEEALGTVMPEGYDGDEAFPAIVRRWWDDLTSEDPARQARARGEEVEDGDDFDGSTVDATDNPDHDALYDGARAPEACDIDGSHDEIRRADGTVAPFCPFAREPCTSGCPSNAERACVNGEPDDDGPPPGRPHGAVSPGDPDWVPGFGPVPGSGASS